MIKLFNQTNGKRKFTDWSRHLEELPQSGTGCMNREVQVQLVPIIS